MSITNKIVLITGSTDGVGRRVATDMAASGAHVLIHGRDFARAERVVDEIQRAGGLATSYIADLSTLAGVRSLATALMRSHQRLDVLINNAGIGVGRPGSGRQLTADGHEWRFAVNYLAGFLLTRLLLPLLRASSPSRIVNVASAGQHPIDFDDVMLADGYSGSRAYCQSKLAQIMFTLDLADELNGTGVTANCLHPATYMDTAMVRNDGIVPVNTVERGAKAIVHLGLSPDMHGQSGLYFDGMRATQAHAMANDRPSRDRLRRLSLDLAGLHGLA